MHHSSRIPAGIAAFLSASLILGGVSDAASDPRLNQSPRPQPSYFDATCPAAHSLAQHAFARQRATSVFKFLNGAPDSVLSWDMRLTDLRVHGPATVLRSEVIGATEIYVRTEKVSPAREPSTRKNPDTPIHAIMYLVGSNDANHATLRSRISALGNAVNAVFGAADGACMNSYLLPGGGKDITADAVAGTHAFAIDPEPATLTANLSNGQGENAPAITPSHIPETALRWPNSFAYTTGFQVVGGQPCSPVSAVAGTVLTDRIVINVSSDGTVRAKCAPM